MTRSIVLLLSAGLLAGCAWTPERVSKMSNADLCYQQWSERSLWNRATLSVHPERVAVVDNELIRRKVDCKNYSNEIARRHQQYLRDMDAAVEIGKFGGR